MVQLSKMPCPKCGAVENTVRYVETIDEKIYLRDTVIGTVMRGYKVYFKCSNPNCNYTWTERISLH